MSFCSASVMGLSLVLRLTARSPRALSNQLYFIGPGLTCFSLRCFPRSDLGGIALVWDLRSGKMIHPLKGHAKQVLCCDFSSNGCVCYCIVLLSVDRPAFCSMAACHLSGACSVYPCVVAA